MHFVTSDWFSPILPLSRSRGDIRKAKRVQACHVASLPGVQSRGTQFLPANKTKPVPSQGIYANNAPAQTWWLTLHDHGTPAAVTRIVEETSGMLATGIDSVASACRHASYGITGRQLIDAPSPNPQSRA